MADALYNAILGDEVAPTPKRTDIPSVVNPNNVGNIRPVGLNTGFQQYKTPEEGIKAVDDQLRIYGEKHGVKTLRGVINRWAPSSENDTDSYIKTVAQRSGIDPDAPINLSDPVVRHLISAPIIGFEKGVKNIIGTKAESKQSSNDPLYNAIMGNEVAQPTTQQTTQPTANELAKPLSYMDKFAQMHEKAKQSNPLLTGIGEAVTSNIINSLTALVGAGKGIVQSIPEAIKTGQAPAPIGERIGSEFIAKHQFEPKTETGKAINQFITSIPEKVTGSAMGFGPLPETMGLLATPKEAISTKGATTELGKQFEKRFPKFEEATTAEAPSTLKGVGAAKAEMNPYGELTGEEKARGEYPVVKLSKTTKDVTPQEQRTRSQIAGEIMPNEGVREGVVTANENTLRNEHTLAKSSNVTPEGEVLKAQIAKEQNALSDYSQKRIENTGADLNLQNDYERGERLSNAFTGDEGATGFIKKAKDAIYQDARATVGDNPIPSTHVESLFDNPQFKAGAGLKGNEGVLNSAQSLIKLAKETGFEDEFGNKFAPNTVGAWDAVKKSLNSNWTPDNAAMIRKINQSIDKDIASAGGGDLLKKADALHQAEKELFASKGIKKIFGEIDSNGVQTATPYEKIPQVLNSMPIDEWKHIYNTADKFSKETVEVKGQQLNIPVELRQAAQAAKNEMAGAIAREVHQAGAAKVGVWNQNSVNKVLNARAEKIKHAFSPEEQKAFHTLNYGGHIMPGVHAYEGGGLQHQRVGLISSKLPATGELAGAFIGGAPGAWTGRKLGEIGQKLTLKSSAESRAKNLIKDMQKNAEKGTSLKDIGKQ